MPSREPLFHLRMEIYLWHQNSSALLTLTSSKSKFKPSSSKIKPFLWSAWRDCVAVPPSPRTRSCLFWASSSNWCSWSIAWSGRHICFLLKPQVVRSYLSLSCCQFVLVKLKLSSRTGTEFTIRCFYTDWEVASTELELGGQHPNGQLCEYSVRVTWSVRDPPQPGKSRHAKIIPCSAPRVAQPWDKAQFFLCMLMSKPQKRLIPI